MHLRTGNYNPHFDGDHRDIGGSCFIYVGNLFTDETDGTTFIVPIIFAVADISADISIGNL